MYMLIVHVSGSPASYKRPKAVTYRHSLYRSDQKLSEFWIHGVYIMNSMLQLAKTVCVNDIRGIQM